MPIIILWDHEDIADKSIGAAMQSMDGSLEYWC